MTENQLHNDKKKKKTKKEVPAAALLKGNRYALRAVSVGEGKGQALKI